MSIFLFGGNFRHFSLYPVQVSGIMMLRACSLDTTIFHLVRQKTLFFCTLSGRVVVANEKMSWIFLSLFYNSNVQCTVNMCDTQKFIFHISEHTKFHTRELFGELFFILSQDKRRFASVLKLTHTEKFEKSQARVRGGKVWRKKKSFWYFHICCSIWRVQMLRFIRTCRT